MDRVLVVQMARMGDLMQTTPLLRGFQKDRRVALLVDERVAEVARRCSGADEVIGVDTTAVFSALKISGSADKPFEAIRNSVADLKDMSFDSVVNVNHSTLSALLSRIPASRHISGYGFNHKRFGLEPDNWFVFLSKMVKYRPLAPFNLADAFFYAAHKPESHPLSLSYQFSGSDLENAGRLLAASGIQPEDHLVALQIGANSPGRQWQPDAFAELALRILAAGASVILLGTAVDRKAADRIQNTVQTKIPDRYPRLIDLVGRTRVSDIAPVLSRASLLVTGDTGPMHIAAAVGCRVVALFFGPAHLYETGPYGEGHYVIRSEIGCCPCLDSDRCLYGLACSRKIEPDMVFTLVKHILYDEPLNEPQTGDVCLYRSGLDEWGVFYHPVFKKRVSADVIQNLCYREMGKCLVDPEYETSVDASVVSIEDEGYAEQEVKRLKHLIYRFYRYPLSVETALFDEGYAFWHPWVEWCRDVRQMGDAGAGQIFAKGLQQALKVLSNLGRE